MRRLQRIRIRDLRRCCLVALFTLVPAIAAHAQLRVVTYNTTGAPFSDTDMATVLRSIGEEQRNGIAKPIDVLLLQEQARVANLPDAQDFVNLLNGMYMGQTSMGLPITYARGNLVVSSGDSTQSIVYRVQTVDLQGELSVGTFTGANPQPRAAIRHQLRPDGYTSPDATFYAYNSHYKAGDEVDDPNNLVKRNTEATAIRSNSNGLGNVHAIYAGDLNLYTAGETAFQTLLATGIGAADNGKAIDPLGLTSFDNNAGTFLSGEWHNNFASSFSHTQSPCASGALGCGVGGGMDDRFDFQLITNEFDDDEGLSMIDGSYHAFGNGGGFCCNNNITVGTNPVTFPGVTSHTKPQILAALQAVTDHIPVVADYQLPAKMSVAVQPIPPRIIQGGSTSIDVTVTNSAPVALAIGADELDYDLETTGVVTGIESGTVNAAAPGTVESVLLAPSGLAGNKTGTIQVTATSQGAANANFSQLVSVDLLDHANASFASGTDQNSLTVDFGQLALSSGTQMQAFDIFNLVATAGFTAALDLDLISPEGDTSVLNTNLTTFNNLAAGGSQSFTALFDTSTLGEFSSTFTMELSDEDLLGAAGQTDLILTLVGEVIAPGIYGDYNNDDTVDAADFTVWRDMLGQSIALDNEDPTVTPNSVTIDDYDVWKAHFGESFPGGGGGSVGVPEPQSAVMLLVGVCLLAARVGTLRTWTPHR